MVQLKDAPTLPEGPVTIMFTDIVESTSLRTTLGDADTDALFAQHDELIRAQVDAHNGFDQHAALGDGFLVVFISTKRAVACAIAIQRALDAFNRQRSGPPLQVRIGLNTGEVNQSGGQISGEAVHAAARVCAAADARQVFISDITRQLAGTVPDVSYRDAGEHDLKGFPTPWRLWDVVWVRETAGPKAAVFVARDEPLARLRDHLGAAIEGDGRLVLIGGEPGVGKTALVRQLISEAERRGALAVFGRCYESEGSVAYSPFVEMLEQALSLMPPDVVREDMGDDAPEIARMVPELRRRFPDIPPALDVPPEQQRRYFFNAVAAFIERGAARFPLLMIMDDVHWADESTLLLIEHIAELVPGHRVLGIGTYRDVELEVSRPLAASLERMVRARTVERISLSRFSAADVATMIEALAGRTPPQAIVDAVFSETEGNPFFVGEVFRHFVEEGRVFDERGEFRSDLQIDELDVPESVRLVVGRRLERLGADAQKALAAAAVIGRAFPFRLLEQVTETASSALLDIVDEAEVAQVLVSEERDGEVVFSFAHELIRQTLLSGLSVLRRQRLHLAVADAIERLDATAATSRPQELADHLMKAGAAADPKRLTNMLGASAQRAFDSAAFETALRYLEDTLALIEDGDPRRGELLELKGKAFRALGRLEDALATWDEAVREFIAADNRDAAGFLTWERAVSFMWLGRFEDAFANMAVGLEAVGNEPIRARLLVFGGMAALYGFGGLYDAAMQAVSDGRAGAPDVTDDHSLGVMAWNESVIGWNFGLIPEAVRAGTECVARLRNTTDAWALADGMWPLSYALLWSGRWEEAGAIAAEGTELANKVGHIGTASLCGRTVAWVDAMQSGDLYADLAAAQQDLPILESINSPWVSLTHAWLSARHLSLGHIDEARHHATEATRLTPASGWTGLGEAAQFQLYAIAGERAAYESLLQNLPFELSFEPGIYPAGQLFVRNSVLATLADFEMTEFARQVYPAAVRNIDQYRYVWFDLMISERIAGTVAFTAGDLDAAERHLRAADRIATDDPNPLDRPQVDYWLARILHARGDASDRDEARARATAARDEFARRGAALLAARAQQLLNGF